MPGGDAEIFDARARRELHAKLAELQAEVDDAEQMNDPERAARARCSCDELVSMRSR